MAPATRSSRSGVRVQCWHQSIAAAIALTAVALVFPPPAATQLSRDRLSQIAQEITDLRLAYAEESAKSVRSSQRYRRLSDRAGELLAELEAWPVPDDTFHTGLRRELAAFREWVAGAIRSAERAETVRARVEEAWRAEATRHADAERRRVVSIRDQRWPLEIERAALERRVVIGMTRNQARAAWGEPDRILETMTRAGTSEQWFYGGSKTLSFDNGTVTSIQIMR